jgi:protein involved in polysaccharide export with SLBB domain
LNIASFQTALAQGQQQLQTSQQFRLAERIIRVAEPGQLADTVNVWGDVNSSGRYLIPKGTTLPELISYSFGPQTLRSNDTQLDWSKLRVEINISEYNTATGREEIQNFKYKFDKPLPEGMRNFELDNNQIIALQVKRRPSFVDYVRVIAPIVSTVATGFLIIDRL